MRLGSMYACFCRSVMLFPSLNPGYNLPQNGSTEQHNGPLLQTGASVNYSQSLSLFLSLSLYLSLSLSLCLSLSL